MRLLIIAFLLFSTLAQAQTIYHVNAPVATVYGLPNETSNAQARLKRGEELQFLKVMESGDWAKIQYGGKIGYIDINSIAEGKLASKVETAKKSKYHVSVFQSAIYVKESFSGGKVETLSQNQMVEIIGDVGEWGKVRTSTGIGFVYMAHLTEGAPKKEKPQKVIKTVNYSVKYEVKMYSKPDKSSEVLKSLKRDDILEVQQVIDGAWAKVLLDRGFGYVEIGILEKVKETSGSTAGGGGNVNMKSIGKAKNPKKFGAICRDGSTDYTVGPHTCSKGNGVKMWIYSAPK